MSGLTLESRTSILVVVEQQQLKKLDDVAGAGNRSAYIRWLIDTTDESNVKRELELEALVKVLQKLPDKMQKQIVKRDLKIAELKRRNQDLKQGKPEEGDIMDLDEVFESYVQWQMNRSGTYIERLSKEPEREWAKIRAQKLDMGVDELLAVLNGRRRERERAAQKNGFRGGN